jgi:ABC-2 type transport system ATP-binding protein
VIRSGEVIADLPTDELLSRFAEDRFRIGIAGSLDDVAVALPPGAQTELDGDVTQVTLRDADTPSLYEFLDQLRASSARLVSVAQVQPDLEEIFIRLIHDDGIPAGGAGRTTTGRAA